MHVAGQLPQDVGNDHPQLTAALHIQCLQLANPDTQHQRQTGEIIPGIKIIVEIIQLPLGIQSEIGEPFIQAPVMTQRGIRVELNQITQHRQRPRRVLLQIQR